MVKGNGIIPILCALNNINKTGYMKRLYFFLVLLKYAAITYSQSLSGCITDEQQQPVSFANIVLLSLPDSAFVQGTISDIHGQFVFGQVDNSRKLLQISCIGYKTLLREVGNEALGTLVLQSDAVMLGETVVMGHRPTYTMKGNTLATNVQNTLLSDIGTGEDVLKRIPGLHIDPEKRIEVFGKGVPLVYINGRQVRDNGELGQLSSKDIAKVELITNPGAEYDAEVKAVLKIKTVKPVGEGLGGYVGLTESKSRHWGHTQQVNLNYRKGGVDLFGSVQHQLFKQWQDEHFTNDIYGDTHWTLQNDAQLRMGDYAKALGLQLGANLQLGGKNSIGATYRLNRMPYSGGTFDAFQKYKVWADGHDYDNMDTYFLMELGNTVQQLNLYYNGMIAGKLGIDFNFDYVKGDSHQDQSVNEQSTEQESRTVTSFSNADYDLYAGKLILSYPLGNGSINWGGEMINTDRRSDYYTLEDIVSPSDIRVEEQKTAVFATYQTRIGNVELNAGLRYEHTQFDYYEKNVKKDEQSRSFNDLFPNLSLSFPLKKTNNSFSYTMKTMRPNYRLLNSAVQYSNRFMYKTGNPLLQPQTMHDITWMTKFHWLNFSVSYQYIKNYIGNENTLYNEEGSILLKANRNYDKYQRLNISVTATPQIGNWQPSWGVYFTRQYFSTMTRDGELDYKNPVILLKWDNDFRLPCGFVLSVSGEYQSDGSYADEQRRGYGMLNLGVRKSFLKHRLTVSLRGNDLLDTYRYRGYAVTKVSRSDYNTVYDMRKVMLSATFRFNATRSKYKGTGVANEEMKRL